MFLLFVLCIMLLFIILILLIQIMLCYKAIDEISRELDIRLDEDTNTLITISSGNRHIKQLAAKLNTQLRMIRNERRHFQSIDFELKERITNVSHDIRTPLTAICGYLDLLKREEQSETIKRYVSIIENRTETLKRLTQELFDYSIIMSTADDMNWEDVVLNSVLEESISAYYAALKKNHIVPKISIPEQKIHKRLNSNALSRIFGNIISNAIKYSDGDLEIVLSETGEIIFSNTAVKLSEVQVGKLFDRFYTVEDAKKSTGLGLSIAKTLTEQMNGTISAKYNYNKVSIHIVFSDNLDTFNKRTT